jgi:hypothetical protein
MLGAGPRRTIVTTVLPLQAAAEGCLAASRGSVLDGQRALLSKGAASPYSLKR